MNARGDFNVDPEEKYSVDHHLPGHLRQPRPKGMRISQVQGWCGGRAEHFQSRADLIPCCPVREQLNPHGLSPCLSFLTCLVRGGQLVHWAPWTD